MKVRTGSGPRWIKQEQRDDLEARQPLLFSDGRPAIISGRLRPFARISDAEGIISREYSWDIISLLDTYAIRVPVAERLWRGMPAVPRLRRRAEEAPAQRASP